MSQTTSGRNSLLESSFDESTESLDLNSVIAEFPNGDDHPSVIPIKKLSAVFESCVQSDVNVKVIENVLCSGNDGMKVYLRVRPVSDSSINTITVESETTISTVAPDTSKRAQYTKMEERHYSFTRVFDGHSKQADVFQTTAAPLLTRFLEGDSCVMFAYGMTNAGKTHTIQGTDQQPGIFPRLINAVLEHMKHEKKGSWNVQASMLEIYQEKIYDLLSKKKDKLNIRDGNGKVEVLKLSTHNITSANEALKLMESASSKRSKSKTILNSGSSRSHAVYTLTLLKEFNGKSSSCIFQVVDLAGAERGNRTKADVEQQKEANIINVSLMQLWRCLSGMRKKDSSIMHLPFRDSKLTHLLMPVIGQVGLAGVVMLTCVNPNSDDYDENISILGNASLACKIKDIADLGRIGNQPSQRQSSLTTDADAAAAIAKKNKKSSLAGKVGTNRDSVMVPVLGVKRSMSANLNVQNDNSTTASSSSSSSSSSNDTSTVQLMSELKQLREEVGALRDENQSLIVEQMQRETEIRVQVSEEMAERSSHLLTQIQDLQDRLYAKESTISDVTKSCKKAKRRQQELAKEDAANDLEEAEEELERVKIAYERDMSMMQETKKRLEAEVLYWKEKAENAMQQQQQSVEPRESTCWVDKMSLSPKRLGEIGKMPSSRSPLTQVDSNSPILLLNSKSISNSISNTKKDGSKVRSQSPMKQTVNSNSNSNKRKTNDENVVPVYSNADGNAAGQTYLKRLRSHFIRA